MTHDSSFVPFDPTLALYVHIPYCRQRCTYCDFNAHVLPHTGKDLFEDYAQALMTDIRAQERASVSTIFWGGGTPSLMPTDLLGRVVECLNERFDWNEDLENTLEVNPGTAELEKFEDYRRLGINRLSIGAQSFHSEHLERVGRIHTADQIEETFGLARRAGFDNVSLDLIYGFPYQSVAQWAESLERAVALAPEHLSIYQLTIEPSTRLEVQLAKGELELPPEDDMIAMDDLAESVLSDLGYERYEVSNWALPGRECRHNLKYWSDSPYLGLGCGAVSFLHGWRFERIKAPSYYQKAMASGRSPVVFAERRSLDGALKDHLMMGLRVKEGVRCEQLLQRYPGLSREQLEQFFANLPPDWWSFEDETFRLTRKGWDFHSTVTMELMNVMFSFS